jgi:hypothetical protein
MEPNNIIMNLWMENGDRMNAICIQIKVTDYNEITNGDDDED